MKILAVEFSSRERSVALLEADQVLAAATRVSEQATAAFELIESALSKAGWQREQIECIALGLGPGSYTGVRAAIALAQGWQLARPVQLLGIASTDCLALEAQEKQWFGPVNIAVDAQRGEFYLARYEIDPKQRVLTSPLRIVPGAEINALVAAGAIVAGPDMAELIPGARNLYPGAAAAARLASGRDDFVPGEKLEPVYLRETSFVKAPPPRKLPGNLSG